MHITKRRNSHHNTFDLQSSRDQSNGYCNQKLNYYTQKGFSTPVKKLKQSSKRINSYHFHSQQKQYLNETHNNLIQKNEQSKNQNNIIAKPIATAANKYFRLKIIPQVNQIYQQNPPQPQGQQQQQNQNNKIKILKDIAINPQRANEFEQLFSKVYSDINQNDTKYNISPCIENNSVNYQFWKFEFCGKGNFQGKTISGVLKFQSDHPIRAPKFYFDPVITKEGSEVLQHENIYGDNSLCIPLLTYWRNTTQEYEISQAIEHIFHNPNWAENDASANPQFSNLNPKEKQQIQSRQAQYLSDFSYTQ